MAFQLFEDLLKKTPSVPDWQNIDPSAIQSDTNAGNAASFAGAKDLASQYNDFQAAQVAKALKTAFPQFDQLQSSGAQVIADRLAGRLSTSDAAAVQRSSAARALGAGTNVAGTTLRDLGIAQYQAQNQGLAALPGFTSTVLGAKKAPMFDFSNTFLSPTQRWQMAYQNQTNQWNVQWLKNQVAAQPHGALWAFGKQADSDITMAEQAAVSYFGGGMGGGGGGGASAGGFNAGNLM